MLITNETVYFEYFKNKSETFILKYTFNSSLVWQMSVSDNISKIDIISWIDPWEKYQVNSFWIFKNMSDDFSLKCSPVKLYVCRNYTLDKKCSLKDNLIWFAFKFINIVFSFKIVKLMPETNQHFTTKRSMVYWQ